MKQRHQASVVSKELMQVMERHQVPFGDGLALLSGICASGIGAEATGSTNRRALTETEMARAMQLAELVRSYIERQLLDWGQFGKL
jgi:hypothetical protein